MREDWPVQLSSAVSSDQEGVFTVLSVVGCDVLQHVNVKGRVQGDVGNQLEGLVLIRGFLQFGGLFSVRSVTEE